MKHRLWIVLPVLLLAACNRGDGAASIPASAVTLSDPNGFLQFLNAHPSLGVGDYTVVAATAAAAQSGSFSLVLTFSDGRRLSYSGSWTSSGGKNPLAAGNVSYPIEMLAAGGVTINLSSTVDAYLYLLDKNGSVISEDDNSGGGTNARLDLPASQINTDKYAQAYYDMIDPAGTRDTLGKWQVANGFGGGFDAHVIFRDVRDLGYGRDMYARRDTGTGDIAVYVRNFQVTGTGDSYSTLNLDAAIDNDLRWHVGTNAIEYSTGPAGTRIVKFYTFNPDGTRRLTADLDGRGQKAMPGPCIVCHGGRGDPMTTYNPATAPDPLVGNSVFPRQGNVWGRMQPLEVDTLEFSTKAGYTRAEQEAALKAINRLALCSYPLSAASVDPVDTCRTAYVPGEWLGDSGANLIKQWYGGTGMPSVVFNDTYVPLAWTPGTALVYPPPTEYVPSGADTIYTNVIATSCRACHALRGTDNQSDIDFSSYEMTLYPATGYNERIKSHIFDSGRMPASVLVFDAFWGSAQARPTLLATFLPGYTLTDAGGSLLRPGRPIANPGPRRTTTTPHKLSAAASHYANSYQWSIVGAPGGSSPTLSCTACTRPTFNANVDGDYTLRLVASHGSTRSDPVDIVISVLNDAASWGAMPLPQNVRFSHIRTLLQAPWDGTAFGYSGSGPAYLPDCMACHEPVFGTQPVFYTDYDRNGDGVVDAADLHQFYLDVRVRVNFADPEQSPILRKPSGNHHGGGGPLEGFDPDNVMPGTGRHFYNMVLAWILNGAPE
jgi:mono/diheme cytochrome c family protein